MFGTLIWFAYNVYGIIESTLDAWKVKKGKKIKHNSINLSVIVRVSLAIGSSCLLSFTGGWVYQLAYIFMLLNSIWIVFDLNFSFVKDRTHYVGNTAITDKIARWIGVVDGSLFAFIKGIPLVIVFVSYHLCNPLQLLVVLSLIFAVFVSIYITYLIKVVYGNKSESKI